MGRMGTSGEDWKPEWAAHVAVEIMRPHSPLQHCDGSVRCTKHTVAPHLINSDSVLIFFFPPSSRIICIWFQGCGYFWKLGQLQEVFSAPNECASIRDTSLSIGVTAVGKVLYRGITWTQSGRQKKTYLKVISAYKQLCSDQAAYKSKSWAAFVYILMFTHQIWYNRTWTTLCWDIKTLKCFAFFWLLIMQSLSLCEGDYSRDLTDSYGNLAWK